MEQNLKIYSLTSGALLLEKGQEALLIGGGYPVERLEPLLEPYHRKLVGILLPNEHSHRMRGLYELACRWNLPLIGHWRLILRELLKNTAATPPQVLTDFSHNECQCGIFHLVSFPVKYDSLYPCGWNVSADGLILGIVQDGRLREKSLEYLKQCNALVLTNCRKFASNNSTPWVKRMRSVYPTEEEQHELLCQAGIALPDYPIVPLITASTSIQ